MIELNSDNRERISALIAKYKHVCDETLRYRDYEWKITAWVVGLILGTAQLAAHEAGPLSCLTRYGFISVVVVFLAAGCAHLKYVQDRLTDERENRKRIEGMLGFDQPGAYEAGMTVVSPAWANTRIRWGLGGWHVVSWVGLMVLAAAYAIHVILSVG